MFGLPFLDYFICDAIQLVYILYDLLQIFVLFFLEWFKEFFALEGAILFMFPDLSEFLTVLRGTLEEYVIVQSV